MSKVLRAESPTAQSSRVLSIADCSVGSKATAKTIPLPSALSDTIPAMPDADDHGKSDGVRDPNSYQTDPNPPSRRRANARPN